MKSMLLRRAKCIANVLARHLHLEAGLAWLRRGYLEPGVLHGLLESHAVVRFLLQETLKDLCQLLRYVPGEC